MTARTYHNADRDITIEIAPRGSGKTTRLIEDAIAYALTIPAGAKIQIVCVNHNASHSLRGMLNRKIEELGLPRVVRNMFLVSNVGIFGDRIVETLMRFSSGHSQNRVYFDGFEFMDTVPILSKAYYTSSPMRRLRQSHTWEIISSIVGTVEGAGTPEMGMLNQYITMEATTQTNLRERTLEEGGRRLTASWTMETADVLEALHGVDAEEEITNILRQEMGIPDEPQEQLSEEDAYLDRLGI